MGTLNQYDKQANEFAQTHGVKMIVSYVGYGKNFIGEKTNRHTYKVTLKRNGKQMTFKFGQSIAAGKTEPRLYDVLTCLTKYDCGTFEEFCHSFGYEQFNDECTRENKVSKAIYKACCKEFEQVERVFGDCLDELREID